MKKYENKQKTFNKETSKLDIKKTVINRIDSIKSSENQEKEEENEEVKRISLKYKTNFNTIPIQVPVPIQTPIKTQATSVETIQKPSRTIKKSNILLNNEENIGVIPKENQEKPSKALININSEVEVEGTIASNSEIIKNSSFHYFNIDFLNINNNQSIINNTDSDSVSNISNNEDSNNEDLFYIPITQRQNNKLNTNNTITNNDKSNTLNKSIKESIINEIKEINNKEKVIYDDYQKNSYFNDDLNEELTDLFDNNDKDNDCIEDFINWLNREETRRNRLKQENDKHINECEILKKRRNMTDNQILSENYRLGTDSTIESFQRKYSYLQKYYAKPAYFQHEQMKEGHVLNRDFNLRTEDEMVNKETLPKVLQKRRGAFGKKGQSKYTHLGDVDTTEFNKDYKIKVDLGRKRK